MARYRSFPLPKGQICLEQIWSPEGRSKSAGQGQPYNIGLG